LENGRRAVHEMKLFSPLAFCLAAVAGFLGCCVVGRLSAHQNIYPNFVRLHPFLEHETLYYPTASQLAATARAQCPPAAHKTLVVIGGNSVFNGAGQRTSELWSSALQDQLGENYHVINFSAPGAGVVDNGGVVFEILSRDYPRALFVTNTEPGYYLPADRSSYCYLFWDAYYKGLLLDDAPRAARLAHSADEDEWREFKLGRRMNGLFHFNDLWTCIAYRHFSTVWTSWLKNRSFQARQRLPDWYDQRLARKSKKHGFEEMLPEHLDALRRRKSIAADRFHRSDEGRWVQTEASWQQEREQIAALLPDSLQHRALVVFTPFNPWFIEHLTDDEKSRLETSARNASDLFQKAGWTVLSTLDKNFEPAGFGDAVHLQPAGGRHLAHFVAGAIRAMSHEPTLPPR
jgi:hypothetical protein